MLINYKKILPNRKLRIKILRLLYFIPDKIMLRIQYRIKTGNKLNLKNPQRFTEKIQWYKLYYKDPLMIQCVDKYEVRNYVKDKGLADILVPCYGVFDSVEEVNWESLPRQFVMKDTLGGGGNSIVIVKDKEKTNIEKLKKVAFLWTVINAHKKDAGREWPYYCGKKHRILFEKYIKSESIQGGLIDYKFFCFYGKARYLYVVADRIIGDGASFGIYDSSFKKLNITRKDEKPLNRIIEKPKNFELLKEIAEKLSESFPEVRVDLYDQNGQILFGELTFYDGSGYMKFEPDQFDIELGSAFKLPKEFDSMRRGGGSYP